jgi:hypothetical protein
MIREMQTKTPMTYHLKPTKITLIKETETERQRITSVDKKQRN